MNLLLLSLLMAFGGQTQTSCISPECRADEIVIVYEGSGVLRLEGVGEMMDCRADSCLPEHWRDPYPSWRMEAQEPRAGTITVSNWKAWTGDDTPVDVLAVQEEIPMGKRGVGPCAPGEKPDIQLWGQDYCSTPKTRLSCADKSRSLEESIDGKLHWCHRMTP